MLSVTPVATEGLGEACGLGCQLEPYWCLRECPEPGLGTIVELALVV